MAARKALKKTLIFALKIGVAAALIAWLLAAHSQLRVREVANWPALCLRLAAEGSQDARSPAKRLWELFPDDVRTRVQQAAESARGAEEPSVEPATKARVVSALNEILKLREYYRGGDFGNVTLGAEARSLLARDRTAMSPATVRRLNRVLLEGALPHHIAKSRKLDPYEIVVAVRQHPLWMALAFLIYNVCIFLTANRWRMLLASQDLHPSVNECLSMTYIGCFFSCILPGGTGGDFVKAYYVARDTHKRAEAVTTVFLDRVFGLYCMIGLGAVALLFHARHLWHSGGQPGLWGLSPARLLVVGVLGAFVAVTIGLVVFLSSHCRRLMHWLLDKLPSRLGSVLKRIYEAVYLYRNHKRVLAKFALYSVVTHSLAAFALLLVGLSLNDPVATGGVRALNYLFLIPLGTVLNGLPIAPAGVGVFEWALAFLFGTVIAAGEVNLGATVAALGHLIILVTNQIGLVFYLKGKRRVAAALHEAGEQAASESFSQQVAHDTP